MPSLHQRVQPVAEAKPQPDRKMLKFRLALPNWRVKGVEYPLGTNGGKLRKYAFSKLRGYRGEPNPGSASCGY